MAKKAWKVVVVDDDPVVLMILQTVFMREGWSVVTAGNGIDGLRLIREQNPDMVVLDLMLPALNGWEICKILREENTIPILMLTALDQEDHLIKGLQLGADDYVTKPFSPREVLARVQAILRRSRPEKHALQILDIGHLCIDPIRHVASVAGEVLRLTPAEFRILYPGFHVKRLSA
jgi:DNA-binding response OmpR family regulator